LKEVKIKVPDEFFMLWESEEAVSNEVMKIFVLALVANKKISQGKGAELLDMNRWDFMDLMAQYNVPALDLQPEELGEGINNLRRALGRE